MNFPEHQIEYLMDATSFSKAKVIALLKAGASHMQIIRKSHNEEELDDSFGYDGEQL